MKSKAAIKGHPIHPMLISFPIAFLTGGFFLNVMGTYYSWPQWTEVGYYMQLVGISTGFIAAIPGFIDYVAIIPPRSSGKRRGLIHMFVMLVSMSLFLVSALLKSPEVFPSTTSLVVESLAIACMYIGGWLGGTLVTRNQISIDHRYANAGKWTERYVSVRSSADKIWIAQSNEIGLNQMKLIHLDNKRLVVARTEEGVVAFDDRCPHRGGSLAGGVMARGVVTCPWHGSQFDVCSGSLECGPAKEGIQAYHVIEQGGAVYLLKDVLQQREDAHHTAAFH